MLTDYILSYDDVRAILGLHPKELPDDRLSKAVFELTVEAYLTKLYGNTIDIYDALVEKKKLNEEDPSNPAPTKLERKIIGLVQLVSTYCCASAVNLDMQSIKKITDGKSEQERFPDALKGIMDAVKNTLQLYTDALLDALREYGEDIPEEVFNFYVASVGLSVDPVTGA